VTTYADSGHADPEMVRWAEKYPHASVDNTTGAGVEGFKDVLIGIANLAQTEPSPLEGIVERGDHLLLVAPVDEETPKGRLILPQVETIRDALDRNCILTVVKDKELPEGYMAMKRRPDLVITDSQAFQQVAATIAPDQRLTSFSILFARKKGDLLRAVRGIQALDRLRSGGKVLVVESCAHHIQGDDIGSVKIPRLFRQKLCPDIEVELTRGVDLRKDYSAFSLALFCGGCMRRRRKILRSTAFLESQGLSVTNYGLFFAWANGLLPRALEPFSEAWELFTH
jgi:[FeFe] hydrogenase H-cluster maturation GTPase HydF